MRKCKFPRVELLAVLLLSICLISAPSTFALTDQTTSNLQAANDAVNQAFDAVLNAQKSGANVIDLLPMLNNAARILVQAENSYLTGDFNTAATKAKSVIPIAHQVTITAKNIKQIALVSNQNNFLSTIAFMVISAFIFVLALFLIWRWFKRTYIEDLYEAKLEVTN